LTIDAQLHVWPLPPPGPLVFVIDWPVAEISAARIEVDAGRLLAARDRVVLLAGTEGPGA
jgi:hypothetical protein